MSLIEMNHVYKEYRVKINHKNAVRNFFSKQYEAKLVIKDSKGFLLNPAGFHIAMPKELLEGLPKRFGAAAPAWVNPPEEEKVAPEKTEDNK